jgi:hypothetical protein
MQEKEEQIKNMEQEKKEEMETTMEDNVSMVEQLLVQEILSHNNQLNSRDNMLLKQDGEDVNACGMTKKMVSFSEDNYITFLKPNTASNQSCYTVDDDKESTTTDIVGADDSGFSDQLDRTYDEIPSCQQADELRLRPLFFEVPSTTTSAGPQLLLSRPSLLAAVDVHLSNARGVVLAGAAASGKTSAILDLVLRSAFGGGGRSANKHSGLTTETFPLADRLAGELVGYHFLQKADAAATCDPGRFVHSLAAQLSQHPALTAYSQYLQSRPQLAALLAPAVLAQHPGRGLEQAILTPLSELYRRGAIRLRRAIIVIDSLHEGDNFHAADQEENFASTTWCDDDSAHFTTKTTENSSNSLADFLSRHLLKFPHWLKLIVSVDSKHKNLVDLMHLPHVNLDASALQEEAFLECIESRLFYPQAADVFIAFATSRRPAMTARLVQLLMNNAASDNNGGGGGFLYLRLVLDQLIAGQLVLKSEAMRLLPHNLAEALQLYFNLHFPTAASYGLVRDLFAVCLTSPRPRSLAEATEILGSSGSSVTYREVVQSQGRVADLLALRSDGSLMFQHSLVEAWLTGPSAGRFRVSLRRGHGLMVRHLDLVIGSGHLRPSVDLVLEFTYHLAGCDLFRASEASALSVMDLKWLYLNFKVDRKDLNRAVSYLPFAHFYSTGMRRLLAISGSS